MLINNLSILMKERNVKNAVLSLKTGISKNTISQLSNNNNSMIQMETINKICQILDVTPAEFFDYSPYEASYAVEFGEEFEYPNPKERVKAFSAFVLIEKNGVEVDSVEMQGFQKESDLFDGGILSTSYYIDELTLQKDKDVLHKYFSVQMQTHIYKMLRLKILSETKENYDDGNVSLRLI